MREQICTSSEHALQARDSPALHGVVLIRLQQSSKRPRISERARRVTTDRRNAVRELPDCLHLRVWLAIRGNEVWYLGVEIICTTMVS